MHTRALVTALKPRRTTMLRIAMLAITGMLAVCVAFPAAAAKKRAPSEAAFASFETCEKKALDMGLIHGQTGHGEFVRECMGMKPSSPAAERR
jgi:hypothetical protein